jgi:hypothetical protein
MLRPAILLTTLALFGCAPKHTGGGAAATSSPAESGGSVSNAKVPDDATSKAFAEKLLKFQAKDFRPADNNGAGFIYKTITFRDDNTWVAEAQMSADDETVDCKEAGTWTMDPAADEHTASMEWKLDKTTCAGRPENNIMRVKVGIDQGEYRIVFH